MAHNTRFASSEWSCLLELRPDRSVARGGFVALAGAIRRGADLRVYTEFLHEEHIAPFSTTSAADPKNAGRIREVIDFRETILVDDWHAAGITLFRQPLEPTNGFNGREPKTSFFLYNMEGSQACANLLLDGRTRPASSDGRTVIPRDPRIPKMSEQEVFDADSSAPSRNFVYEMEIYRFFVRDDWTEILAHDADGRVVAGSLEAVEQAQIEGREIKVGIRDLCHDLGSGPSHEVFSYVGSTFFHTGRRFYEGLTHPLVRVAAAVPLAYASKNWDLSWVSLRTDGFAVVRTLDCQTRTFSDRETRFAVRWFAR